MLECKQSQIWKISNSRADNSDNSDPIKSIIELIQDLMITYILTMFGAYWSIFVDDREQTKSYSAIFPNSRVNYSGCSGSI